jgi:hypothetical protein
MSKRIREGTPRKESRLKLLQEKMGRELENKVENLMGALGNVRGDKIKELKDSMVEVMKKFVVPVLETQGTLVSDLISQIMELEKNVEVMEDSLIEAKERIKDLENCREKTDVKVSRKEMTEKVVVSAKQFKLLDIDFGREISERKDLLKVAKEKIGEKVRSDKKNRYDELVRKATIQVLAKATVRRKEQDTDKEIWTAPVLVSVDERESRWELEDVLRQSKVYPTFHWSKEMLAVVRTCGPL